MESSRSKRHIWKEKLPETGRKNYEKNLFKKFKTNDERWKENKESGWKVKADEKVKESLTPKFPEEQETKKNVEMGEELGGGGEMEEKKEKEKKTPPGKKPRS